MAKQGEPMDIDDISEFDDKENSLQHGNVLSHQTDKGYEELDVSELNMKLRWSMSTQFTPNSSPMSKSSTPTCLGNKSQDSDALNNTLANGNSNLSNSFNSSTAKSDTLVKSPKLLPLQVLPSADAIRNLSGDRPFDDTVTRDSNDITVTVTGASDNDDNYSLASSSTSPDCTPEATTPIKDIPKPTGSPIMRGIKSVLNMFRPSQSPIPPEENEGKTTVSEILHPIEGISPLTNENALDSRPQSVLASTPIANNRKDKECYLYKRNSPLKESIVFNEDLEKELEWKEDSTIIFSNKEKTPFHKLFFNQQLTSPESSSLTESNLNIRPEISQIEQNVDAFVEPMDVSYNNSILKDKTITHRGAAINETKHFSENELEKDESEFLDCETTINESQLCQLMDDTREKANGIKFLQNQNMSAGVNYSGPRDISPEKKQGSQNTETTKHDDVAIKTVEISSVKKIVCEDKAVHSNNSKEILDKSVSSNIASLNSSQVIDKLPSLLENFEGTKPNTTSVITSNVAANIDCNIINTVALNTHINQSESLSVATKIDQSVLDQSLGTTSNTPLLLNQTIDIIKYAKIPLPQDELRDIESDVKHDPKLDMTVDCKVNDVNKLIETVPRSDIVTANSDAFETAHISLIENTTLPNEEVLSIQKSEKIVLLESDILNKSTISLPEYDFNNPDILDQTSEVFAIESIENKELVQIVPIISKVSDTKQAQMESVQDYTNDTNTVKGNYVSVPTTPDIQPKLNETTIFKDSTVTFTEFKTSEENMQLTESVGQLKECRPKISETIKPEYLQKGNSSLDDNFIPCVNIVTQPTLSIFNTPAIIGNASEVISKEFEDKKDDAKPISAIVKVTELKQEAEELVQGYSTMNETINVSLPGTPDHKLKEYAIPQDTHTKDNFKFKAEFQTPDQSGQLNESMPEIDLELVASEAIEEDNKSFEFGLGQRTDIGFQHTTTNFSTTEVVFDAPILITKDSGENKAVLNIPDMTIASTADECQIASIQGFSNINKEDYVPEVKSDETAIFKDGNETLIDIKPTTKKSQFTPDLQTADNSCQLIASHDINIKESVELEPSQEENKYSDVKPHENDTQPINYIIEEPMDISMAERDIVQVNVTRTNNPNLCESLAIADILSTKNNDTPKDIEMVEEGNEIQAINKLTTTSHLIERLECQPMDISACEVKEQTRRDKEKIVENVDNANVINKTESNKQECLNKITSTDILMQQTEEDKEIEVLDEDLIFSENNSPYVSLSAPEELSEQHKAEEVVSTKTNITISASAPISFRGYNIDFYEIENPFVSKTKIRLSPNLNQTFEPIDKVPASSSFTIEQSPIKPEPNKTTLDGFSLSKDTQLDDTQYTKDDRDSFNPYKPTDLEELKTDYLHSENLSPEDLTLNTDKEVDADIFVNKCYEEIKDDIPATNQTDILDIASNTNITSQALEGAHALDNFATSSSEQSAYYSAGTFSNEETESKPTSSLSDVDEINVDPFASKSKVEKTPPPDSEDLSANKSNIPFSPHPESETENLFKTKSKIRQSPQTHSESEPNLSLSDVDEMNLDPFASKSKVEQTPPPDLGNLSAKKSDIPLSPHSDSETENPFQTISKIQQLQPPNSENLNSFETKTLKGVSPNTSCIFARPDVFVAENIERPRTSENKFTAEDLYPETEKSNKNNMTCSERLKVSDEKDSTDKEVLTEDEETLEGPFIEADLGPDLHNDHKLSTFENENEEINQFTDLPPPEPDDNFEAAGEMFIDADAFEFLMNQNKSGEVPDSGKESLFLKFDPLFARRVNSDGIVDVLSKLQKRQSTPKKIRSPLPNDFMSLEKSPIAGPSNEASAQNTTTESSCEDLNITVAQKPTMVVPPAVNPVVTPRKKATTPVRSCNRLSMNFTSPAMAVIDRLLSLSTNNSPASPERAPPINMEQREADRALMQLRELLAEKELNVHHLRCESKELKDRFAVLDSQMKSLEAEGEKRLKNIKELNEKLAEKNQVNKTLSAVVAECERTIAGLFAGIEEDKKKHAKERLQLITERDEQTAHLASMEVAFSDLHSKYEKSKQIILSCKAREDAYRKSKQELEDSLVKLQNNYELLKQHATSKLNHANQELEKMNRSHESEVLKLNAMIKRKDLHISSLEETLAQKTKANEELTAICDDLINRVG